MGKHKTTRRRFIAGTAAASAAAIAAPYVRGAHAAGSLSIAFWDHWVPGGNTAMTEICQAWADKEKVDLKIDYVSTQGNKLLLTVSAEAHAKSGHDIIDLSAWEPSQHARLLEPVDDVMREILARNGAIWPSMEYLAKIDGKWVAMPSSRGTLVLPPCTRYDLLKDIAGVDIRAMYPAGAQPAKEADTWTWDTFLTAAEKCHKAGHAFGLGLGTTTDSVDWVGALFQAYGAELVNAKGEIQVKSDNVREVLDYATRLAAVLPPDVASWDNASNNKWLVSGKGALIFNPPSAWVVAKRDVPDIAQKLWTHAMPKGPKGRCVSLLPRFQAIWNFSKNKSAAKSLLLHISTSEAVEKLVAGGQGYDLPPYPKFNYIKTWDEQGPPAGVTSHYPNKGDQVPIIPCSPAPHAVAAQMYTQGIMTKMIVRLMKGEERAKTLDWTAAELEGFTRN